MNMVLLRMVSLLLSVTIVTYMCYHKVFSLRLSGLIVDFIIRRDGNYVYDAIFAYALNGHVRQFKAIQTDLDTLIIYIVPVTDLSTKAELSICANLRKYLGNDMKI